MNRLIVLLCVCFSLMAGNVLAQLPTFSKGDNVVSASLGFGGTLFSGYTYYKGYTRLPAFTATFEHCVVDNLFDEKSSIGVGGIFGVASASYNSGVYGWRSTSYIIGARGAFHYSFVDKLDTYAGTAIGYNINTWKWTGNRNNNDRNLSSSGMTAYFFVGARYYFTDSFGAFAELGYGFAFFNLGVSLKF